MRSISRLLALGVAIAALGACSDESVAPVQTTARPSFATAVQTLGARIYADVNLSVNKNQSCQTCHEPSEGFASALSGVKEKGGAIEGSVPGNFGARKPPSAAYATLAPRFTTSGGATGGVFWDGRATGAVLGSPAADQALGPFLNPVEQALPDAGCVVYAVRNGSYASDYRATYGSDIDLIAFPANTPTVCATPTNAPGEILSLTATDRQRVTIAYNNIAVAVAQFEATFNKFSSKADAGQLSALEKEGLKLFGGKGKCQQCHTNKGAGALFTDFRFHNLGLPHNPDNVEFNYQTGAFDRGLGGFTGNSKELGMFRTPTTRNVGLGSNRSYMHNGVLKSLRQVVDFYNTRDALRTCTLAEVNTLKPEQYGSFDPDGSGPLAAAKCWPAPEYARTMDTKQMGNLGLTPAQVDAIVAYLMAMTDL